MNTRICHMYVFSGNIFYEKYARYIFQDLPSLKIFPFTMHLSVINSFWILSGEVGEVQFQYDVAAGWKHLINQQVP